MVVAVMVMVKMGVMVAVVIVVFGVTVFTLSDVAG